MKLVALWLTILGLAIAAVAGSCSINHRSGDFVCQTQADCASDRFCIGGFCVLTAQDAGGSPTIDAPSASDGGSACPPACTSCDVGQNSCLIDCAANPDECNQPVACPAGWSCSVMCSTDGSCRSGVSCDGTTSCTIACSGPNSCKNLTCGDGTCDVTCTGRLSCNGVQCGAGHCTVQCNAAQSCNTVDCGNACACDVACRANGTCANLTCTAPACQFFGGCSSTRNATCDTCQ